MLIGWLPVGTAVLEIPTGFALGMTNLIHCCVKSISIIWYFLTKMISNQSRQGHLNYSFFIIQHSSFMKGVLQVFCNTPFFGFHV